MTTKKWEHRYSVTSCPRCKADFRAPASIDMVVSVDGATTRIMTKLDPYGLLVDVNKLIANGYHSDTLCGSCSVSLADREVT